MSAMDQMLTNMTTSGSGVVNSQIFTITMVMYLIMTLFFSWLLRFFEKRMDGPAEYDLATTDTLAFTSGTLTDPRKDFVDDRKLSDGAENIFRENDTRR